MLRALSAKNFVHFQRGINLTFQPGVNFFIGRSATGKSAAIELICRCHDSKLNESRISTIPNPKEAAYAFCLYENVGELKCGAIESLLTAIYADPINKKIYKMVVVEHQNHRTVYAKEMPLSLEKNPQIHINPFDASGKHFRLCYLNEDKFFDLIKLIKEKRQETPAKSQNIKTNVDTILHDLLVQFAASLPHRGISPIMWTEQLASDPKENSKLCLQASQRADVLQSLLDDNENVDLKMAERIFNQLCSDSYEFLKMENNEIVVKDSSGVEVPLIKVPAGALEAKELSLLLAHKRIRTLCLEEPYRGMHQGMVKKLGQLILQRITDKTVIIVSHEQALVNSCSLQNTFVFKKSWAAKDNSLIHEAVQFPCDCRKYGESEDMKSVLFSSGVILVEGETDRIILQALFDQIVQKDKHESLRDFFSSINAKTDIQIDVIEATFARLDVIKLDGEKSGLARQKFCNDIGVSCVLLLDRNAVLKGSFPCGLKENYLTKDRQMGSTPFKFETQTEWNSKYNDTSKYLANCDIFVWKEGDIEDVLIKEIPKEKEIYGKMELEMIVKENKNSKERKRKLKEWKSRLKSHDPDHVNTLAISALGDSSEQSSFGRLILFLVQKFSNQTLNTSTKRV